jgi:hypothetical protein
MDRPLQHQLRPIQRRIWWTAIAIASVLIFLPTDLDVAAIAFTLIFGCYMGGLFTERSLGPGELPTSGSQLRYALWLTVFGVGTLSFLVLTFGAQSPDIERVLAFSKSARRPNAEIVTGSGLIFGYGSLLGAILRLALALWIRRPRNRANDA